MADYKVIDGDGHVRESIPALKKLLARHPLLAQD